MIVPRTTVTLEASIQPGVGLNPTKLESEAGRASSLTTVPTGNETEHAPAPLPRVIVQSIPAGCEVTLPLPVPPGTIAMVPLANRNCVHTVMIPYVVAPPAVPMMSADWGLGTTLVLTGKLADLEPAGTVTLAGTVAAAVLSLESAT